jgi:hypothetical protein
MKLFILILLATALNTAPANAADNLGRLFSSPAERSNLDYLRQTKKVIVAAPIAIDAPNIVHTIRTPVERAARRPVTLPNAINMQGYVKRNDGKQGTVWVNNQAMQENSSNRDIQVGELPENSNRIPIKLNANGKRINIKAGQVYQPQTNQVHEARNHAAQGDSGIIGDSDDEGF